MPHDPYKALYLHIPFCVKRCGYCDFATKAIDCESEEIDRYIEMLVLDVRRYSKQDELGEIESVYIGGGTPSFIGTKRLSSLLYAISVSTDLTREGLEFTMEANPDSLDCGISGLWGLIVYRSVSKASMMKCFGYWVALTMPIAHVKRYASHRIDLRT